MRKINYKKISIIVLAVFLGLVLLSVIGFYGFRDQMLDKAIVKVSNKMLAEYNSTFVVKEAEFIGFNEIELKEVSLVPKNADTLLDIERIKTSVNYLRLLTGDVQLGTLEMNDGYIQLVRNKNGKNFDAFLKKNNKVEEKDNNEGPNYGERAYNLLTTALNLVPTDMKLDDLTLKLNDMGRKVNMNLQQLRLVDKQLVSSIGVKANEINQTWEVKGFADPRNRQADLKFFNKDTARIAVPYIDERYGVKTGFDSIRLNIADIDLDGDEMRLEGFASIDNFMVNHPRIAKKDVVIDEARFDFHFLFGEDFVAIDSSSTAVLNKIKVQPFVQYSVEKDTTYALKVDIPDMKAQDFIESLPHGLFTNFEGMQAEGTFSYSLDFMYNKNKPNALVFDSSLKKNNLKILKYGEADLNKLNGTFTYRAIDKGIEQRPVIVGPSNPNFTPLGSISHYLRNAVLTSEDPSFYRHRGFITEAFKQSIIKNIKTKKFARGASTISMQLVKNVFLTREKTLSRKLEEILLVYILENNRIVSKERMLEVYFNIIEWGPNVYGIGEAARYYFYKHPSELSLDESVFLASIVPKPKSFMWQFNSEGNLKPHAVRHSKYIKNIMLRRGLLVPEDTIAQTGFIYVSGSARSRLPIKEQVPEETDTLQIEFDEFDF
jgi:hypothetical protein